MGHLLVLDHDPATLDLTRRSLELWHELAARLPPEAEWGGAGTLWLARDEAELERARARAEALVDAGVDASVLGPAALRELEPCLAPSLVGGLRLAGDRIVYPPVIAAWMLAQAEAAGAELKIGVAVEGLEPVTGGERVVLASGEVIHATQVVLAAGLGSRALLAGSPATRPFAEALSPRRGHLLITGPTGLNLRHQLIELGYHDSVATRGETSVAFNLQPRAGGQLLLGSSRSEVESETRELDAEVLARMIARARAFVPGLDRALALRAWVGFRPASADGLPLIGPLPSRPTLLLACGHEGLGITTSLATAELIHGHLGGFAQLDGRPFSPHRLTDDAPPRAGDPHDALPRRDASDHHPL